ncbi:hypothetical protein ACO0RG_000598 [Hanseniaspora osmophila]
MNKVSVKSEAIDGQGKKDEQSGFIREENNFNSSKVKTLKPKIFSPHFGSSPNTSSISTVLSTKKRRKKTLFQQSKSSKSYQNSSVSGATSKNGFDPNLENKSLSSSLIVNNISANNTMGSKNHCDDSLMDVSSSKVKLEDSSRSIRKHDVAHVGNTETKFNLTSSFSHTDKENIEDISFSKMFSTPQFSKHSKVDFSQPVKQEKGLEHSQKKQIIKNTHHHQSMSLPEIDGTGKDVTHNEEKNCQSFDDAWLPSLQKFYLKEPEIGNMASNGKKTIPVAEDNSQSTVHKKALSFPSTNDEKSLKNIESDKSISQETSLILPEAKRFNKAHCSASTVVKKNVSFSLNNISIISGETSFEQKNPIRQEEPIPADCRDPGKYHAINELLYDRPTVTENEAFEDQSTRGKKSLSYIDLFQDVGDTQAQEVFASYGALSLEQWVQTGLDMNAKHQALLEKIIVSRLKLSYKFKVITDLLNEKAQELNQNADLINEKLNKIKDLGNEILNIM